MKQPVWPGWQFLKYLAYLMSATLLCAGLLSAALAHAIKDTAGPAWASPGAMAVRRVGNIPDIQREPNFLNNLDCTLLTYRLGNTQSMRTGCFTETAFGTLDSDSETAIFIGTDEGLPILPYSVHEVLVPWPGTESLLALDAAVNGGSYINLYKDGLAYLHDQRNALLQLTAKQLAKPPDLPLTDASGAPLVINPQTLAFSSDGSWLVVETLGGSFVRINLATLDMTAFAPAFGSLGSPGLLKSQVAISDNGRYVAIANKDAGSLKVYDLTKCGPSLVSLPPETCAAYDYQSFVVRQISGFLTVKHLRFVNDDLLSFDALTNDSTSDGMYELAPEDSINSLIDYLALGDSYTSGEGAFNYVSGTDTPDDMCHLSARSYPLLVTHDLFSGAGGHSVACSGAEINDVGNLGPSYRGQVRGVGSLQQLEQMQPALLNTVMADYLPGYVAQQRFVKQYQPGITTVSIGGNDIGFGDILRTCVMPHAGMHQSCYNTYEDRVEITNLIDRTVPRWIVLYKQLLREAPGTQLYVIGYPQIAYANGDCALNVHLDKAELVFSEQLINYLDAAIKQAADAAGVRYVDISQALAGHRLCEAASYDVAMNGLTAGTDSGPPGLRIFGKESYHPNALGQALIAQAILRQTDNLKSPKPVLIGPGDANILKAPKTGRSVNALVPDDGLTVGVAQAGTSMAIRANGARDGLVPNTLYTIRLDGSSGMILGSTTSDNNGEVSASVPLPDNTSSGGHSVDLTGNNQADEPVDVTQPIYVPVSDNDADGDSIPDSLDTCPGITNSGQDNDRDGIDDACNSSANPSRGAGGQTDTGASGSSTMPTTPNTHSSSPPGISPDNVPLERTRGTLAVNMAAAPVKHIGVPTGITAVTSYKPFAKLYIINWLIGVIALAGLWLLASLALYAKQLVRNRQGGSLIKATAWYVPNLRNFNYNRHMIWVRKGIVHLLALVLFVALVGGAFAASTNLNLTHTAKLEAWLNQSNVYSSLVTNALHDAQQSASNDQGAGRVSLNDPEVQQAVRSVFSSELLQQYTDIFLKSNYAWLEGKTAAPSFKIDLTSAKQALARQIGQRVETRVAGLPACSSTQLAQLQTTLNTDPLSTPCRPPTLTPQTAGAQATAQINESSDFLNQPIITAAQINPNDGKQGQPYYQKLSALPKLYRLNLKLPWIFGGLALLSILGIVFIAPQRRKGVRRVGIVFVVAGIVLVAVKFVADSVFNQVEKKAFANSNIGQLQQSLTSFLHQLESQLVRVDLWFGAAFTLLGLILLGTLLLSRRRAGKKVRPPDQSTASSDGQGTDNRPPLPVFKQPSRPKRPRLIQ